MARSARDVTEAELAVMRILWDDGPRTVREIADQLSTRTAEVHVATVQKLLERLEDKNWVTRDKSDTVQRFSAAADRGTLIGRRLKGIAEELCEGSMTPLLSHLVHEGLSKEDRQSLRDLIDQLDQQDGRKRRRSAKSG